MRVAIGCVGICVVERSVGGCDVCEDLDLDFEAFLIDDGRCEGKEYFVVILCFFIFKLVFYFFFSSQRSTQIQIMVRKHTLSGYACNNNADCSR